MLSHVLSAFIEMITKISTLLTPDTSPLADSFTVFCWLVL